MSSFHQKPEHNAVLDKLRLKTVQKILYAQTFEEKLVFTLVGLLFSLVRRHRETYLVKSLGVDFFPFFSQRRPRILVGREGNFLRRSEVLGSYVFLKHFYVENPVLNKVGGFCLEVEVSVFVDDCEDFFPAEVKVYYLTDIYVSFGFLLVLLYNINYVLDP